LAGTLPNVTGRTASGNAESLPRCARRTLNPVSPIAVYPGIALSVEENARGTSVGSNWVPRPVGFFLALDLVEQRAMATSVISTTA
jgi:hypothetical protein